MSLPDASTTVALGQFEGRGDACNGTVLPALDASAASMTSVSSAPRALDPTRLMPPTDAALPAPSTGATRYPAPRPPFLAVTSDRLCPCHRQKGVR